MTATNRTVCVPVLLMFALAGCGSSAATPKPTVAPISKPVVIAQVDSRFDIAVGRLQAVQFLLSGTDSQIASAFSSQSVQLPDSAVASFTDARYTLVGARVILAETSAPPKYVRIQSLLSRAFDLYSRAQREGMTRPSASRDAADRAQTLLGEANTLLLQSPEGNQAPTIAERNAALALANRAQAAAHPRPKKVRRVRPRVHVHKSPTPVPTQHITFHVIVPSPTSAPTSVPTATTAPSATPIPTRQPQPTPTSRPTRVPTIASTIAPTATPKPHPTKTRTPSRPSTAVVALVHFSGALQSGKVDMDQVSLWLTKCEGYLTRLSSGDDPMGSSTIAGCIKRTNRIIKRVISTVGQSTPPRNLTIAIGWRNASIVTAHHTYTQLHLARGYVTSAQFEMARHTLLLAAQGVASVQHDLDLAQHALKANGSGR